MMEAMVQEWPICPKCGKPAMISVMDVVTRRKWQECRNCGASMSEREDEREDELPFGGW